MDMKCVQSKIESLSHTHTPNKKRKSVQFESRSENESGTEIKSICKKEKIDKTLFTPKIVMGIKFPTLPSGFIPIPESDNDYEYEYKYTHSEKKLDLNFERLNLLANIACMN